MRKLNKTAEEIVKSAQEIIAWHSGDWAPKDVPYDGEAICVAIDRFLKDNKKCKPFKGAPRLRRVK